MAGALVGTFTAAEGTGNLTTGSRTTTAGNLITGHAASFEAAGGGTAIAITDNKSNAFTEPNELAFGSDEINLATAYNANGTRGATHTLTATYTGGTGVGDGHTMVAHEWSGIDASPTVVSGTNTGTSTAPSVSATAITASFYIGMVCYGGTSTTIAVNGSTQASETDENSDFQAQAVAYRATLTGSNSVAWTLAASREWGAIVSAFTEAAAGGAITGTIAMTITPTGALTGTGALSGSVPVTFTPTGALTGTGALAGSIAFAFSPVGVLRGAGALSGSISAAFSPTGTLTGSGALASTTSFAFTPVGALSGTGALVGTATVAFDVSGTLSSAGSGAMAGDVPMAFTAIGALTGTGALSGAVALSFTPVGALTGTGALSGTSALTFTTTGALADSPGITGSIAVDFTVSGLLTGTGGEQNSGGYGFYNDFDFYNERRRRRKKREQEALEEAQQIQAVLDREIAQLLHEQEAKDAEREDLKRIQSLADKYAGTLQKVPRAISATLLKAQEERSKNALEQLTREMEQMIEAEDMTAILMLLNQ